MFRKMHLPIFKICVYLQVRGAFFEVVCTLCEFTPALVQAEAPRFCPAVLLSIDDTDPVVLPPVWEAVLHVVSTIPVSFTFWPLSVPA